MSDVLTEYACGKYRDEIVVSAMRGRVTLYRKRGGKRFAVISENVLSVKAPDILTWDALVHAPGLFPSAEVPRGNWVSASLDGSVPEASLFSLLDTGWTAVSSRSAVPRPPKEWLIPANPIYFDIVHAFDSADTIHWKQGAGIRKGDTVYIYAGEPVGAVLFRCMVLDTDIPREWQSRDLVVRKAMLLRLERRYSPSAFPRFLLKEEYGVYSVRGPRGVPNSLSCSLRSEDVE